MSGELPAERCESGLCKDELLLELLLLLHTLNRAAEGASWSVVLLQTVNTPGASCWSSPGEAVSHEEDADAWCLPPQSPPATAQR